MFDKVALHRFVFLYKENFADLRARDTEHEAPGSAEIHSNRSSVSSLLWINGFFFLKLCK